MSRTPAVGLALWILFGFTAIVTADSYLEALLGFILVVAMTTIGVVMYDARED